MTVRPVLFTLVALVVLWSLVVGLVRLGHPEWWRWRPVRRALFALPVFALVALVAWIVPVLSNARSAAAPGAFCSALVFVTLAFLALSLPVSSVAALFVRVGDWAAGWMRRRRGAGPPARPAGGLSRRQVLLHATAAIPAAALGIAGAGVVGAFRAPRLRPLEVAVAELPAALEGLRILQLTDIHLGTFVDLDELERVLVRCDAARPDLVVVTGDACDDMRNLDALARMIQGLRPPLGTFASLGNHEYYRGVSQFERAWGRAGVPLLVSAGLRVPVGDSSIFMAGADDPAVMGRPIRQFLRESVEAAIRDRHEGETAVLMSHRPDGFDPAAARDVTLTLAGHTHGGQIGFGGRSAFEPFFPHWYLRGRYERGGATLLTSAGLGHWFPFRLDCPAEVPVVTLTRA